jgi:hypothetical protein
VTSTALQLSDLESSWVSGRTYVTRRRAPRIDGAIALCVMLGLLMIIPTRYIVPGMTDFGRPGLVMCMLLFAWWVLVRFTSHLVLIGPQPMRWVMLAFGLTMLASYVVGELRNLTTIEANSADRALMFVASFAGAALAAADGISNWNRLQVVLRFFVYCGTFMAVIGLIQFGAGIDLTSYLALPGLQAKFDALGFEVRGGGVRVASTATHYIELATVLATVLPFALQLAIFAKDRRRRLIFGLCAVLLTAGVLATISRSGILGVAIVVVVLFPMWGWRLRYNIVALAAVMMAALTVAKPSLVRTLTRLFDNPSSNPAFTVRQARYPLVWHYVAQRPWLGRGTGTYLAPQYQILDNYWLSYLISNGIIGVAVLAGMHLTGVVLAFKAMRRATEPEVKHLAACLIATQLTALVVAGTYDSLSFLDYAIVVAFTLGLCGTIWRLTHPAAQVRTSTTRWYAAEQQPVYIPPAPPWSASAGAGKRR